LETAYPRALPAVDDDLHHSMKPIPLPRLSMLQASRADVAVIFRRGPSKWVEVIRWDTQRDHFERGAWFNGRIYQRRCDLSPDGELLIYFASRFTSVDKEYTYAWTAVSRPPWLTALALWPKGNCWWGGGLFLSKRQIWLNHRPEEALPHPKHKPRGLRRVEANPEAHGEDGPIYYKRLMRDGWDIKQELEIRRQPKRLISYETIRPEIRVRGHPKHAFRIIKELRVVDLKAREWFAVEGPSGPVALPPGRLDWVDWDGHGRLILLVDGMVRVSRVDDHGVAAWTLLLDLRDDKPERRPSPPEAWKWL
jgi:hypothetical protein